MPEQTGQGRKKSGHWPNDAQKRNRARYRTDGHLRRNKIRHIRAALVTTPEPYGAFLRERLSFWGAR